ncbi:metal-dependent hydrolase [Bacillus songklensis]|uniref:Metal-dependent hydrolase n=1 Tax=Bacillus songklensis TaxID=1069116 RepID=A0ABV8AZ87_9BACI
MRYHTHVATSIAAGAGIAAATDVPFTVTYVLGIALGSLIPDIDEPNSYIGRRTFGLSKLIKQALGHRGFTHSLLAWITFSFLYKVYPNSFVLGMCIGYIFHIVGDFFSRKGVPLFSPLSKKRFKSPLTYETGSFSETLIFYAAVFASIYIVYTNQLF